MNPKTLILAATVAALVACSGERATEEKEADPAAASEPNTEQQGPATQAYYGDEETPEVLEDHGHDHGDHGHDHGEDSHGHPHGDEDDDGHGHGEDDHGHDH